MTTINFKSLQRKRAHVWSPKRMCVRIGGISAGVTAAAEDMRLTVDHEMQNFLVPDQACDIEVTANWTDSIHPQPGPALFETGSLWRLVREGYDGLKFEFTTPALGTEPYKSAFVDATISRAEVLLNRRYFTPDAAQTPIEYPLNELLFIHKLARESAGVEVHACGVVAADGKGRLFVGHSGAGKSTMSRLWQAIGALVLSDDRIILRMENGQLRMYGTPWHGDAGLAAQASASVDAIFLLEQAPLNRTTRLKKPEAAVELFARSFLPFHAHAGISSTLSFLDRAVTAAPCYHFEFLPDISAVEHAART